MKKSLVVLALLFVMLASMPATVARAFTLSVDNNLLNSVTDTFSDIRRPDPTKPWDYWWVTLNSVSNGQGRVENQNCSGGVNGNSNCVIALQEGSTDFARMVERPGKAAGDFYLAQMSDVKDSAGPSVPLRWEPQVNQPVVYTVRARFSANYLADGSNARGTAGIGFWNQPTVGLDNPPYVGYYKAPQALWFTYTENDTLGGLFFTGLTANYVDQNTSFLPSYTNLHSVNMSDWNLYSIVWSVNSSGQQHAKFLINAQTVADYDMAVPMPAMSLLSWVDSSLFTLTGQIVPSAPTADQSLDIDFINVSQPRI